MIWKFRDTIGKCEMSTWGPDQKTWWKDGCLQSVYNLIKLIVQTVSHHNERHLPTVGLLVVSQHALCCVALWLVSGLCVVLQDWRIHVDQMHQHRDGIKSSLKEAKVRSLTCVCVCGSPCCYFLVLALLLVSSKYDCCHCTRASCVEPDFASFLWETII